MTPMKTAVGYRRNGKKQACEPCRKGKLACDHGSPFCGRCTRRKTTAKCIYHPAPMTRGRGPSGPVSISKHSLANDGNDTVRCDTSPAVATSNPPFFHSPQPFSREVPPSVPLSEYSDVARPLSAPSTSQSKSSMLGQPPGGWKTAVYPRSRKFYGPTSFSAIFSDSDAKFYDDILNIGEDKRRHPGNWIHGKPLHGFHRPNGPYEREKTTLRALWNLPSKETCEMLVTPSRANRCPSLNFRLFKHCVKTLFATFGSELATPRDEPSKSDLDWRERGEDPPALIVMTDALFKNEELPLPPDPDDALEWLNNFTGPNLRFEMLGMLFCFLGLAYLALQDWDPVFSHGRDKKQIAWRMKECADVCLTMCDYSETVNYLVTALILNIKRLETGCAGDETYKMRRLHGDMVTTAITSGLHRLPEYGTGKVTAASEYKRRLFGNIYCSDKIHSSLNGTPPLLTRQYCDVQLCLDISDDVLYGPQEELAEAINKLDADGWNTSGACHEISTVLRSRIKIHAIREEILELSLGVNVDVSAARINDLHQKSQEMFDSLPPQLHYYDQDGNPKNSTGDLLYDQAFLSIQHLQNKFLIDRVAKARGLENGQGLLNTAMEMIDLSLMFWSKRDQMMSHTYGFDWIMTYYGIPSAGVICVELLKSSAGQSPLQFSRSDAIQKLTLFIAFLEWIRPTDGNYTLAQRLRKVLRRVLDFVLDAGAKESVADAQGAGAGEGAQMEWDPMLAGWEQGDEGDLNWLSAIDWTQGSWMDFT